MDRAKPPADIAPEAFFTQWVPQSVATDDGRRSRLADTRAVIVFALTGPGGGDFTVRIDAGVVTGEVGAAVEHQLAVRVDVATWRQLNCGEISAPEALLRRRIKLKGDFILGLKLHLILG
jgi:putative sterol carrier protein